MAIQITVIIPVHNGEAHISDALDSLLRQSFSDYQIIIVNDGSTDNTLSVCRKYQNRHANITIIDKEKTGVSASRNQALKQTDTPFVTFVDADDTVKPNHLEILYKEITEYNADLSITAPNYVAGEGYTGKTQNNSEDTGDVHILGRDEAMFRALKSEDYKGFVWNKLYKTEIICKNNICFDESISMKEDLLFTAEYLKHCTKAVYTDVRTYNYIQRSGSAMHDFNKEAQYRRYMNMFAAVNKTRDCINDTEYNSEVKKMNVARTVDDYSGILRVISVCDDKTTQKYLREYILKNYPAYFSSEVSSYKRKAGVLLFTLFPKLGYLRHRKMIGS